MPDAPRVVIADGPTLCREGLTGLLSQAGFEIIVSTSDGDEAISSARASSPDIAVVNVGAGSDGGFALASRIIDASPKTRVVLVSLEEHRSDVLAMIRSGASAYILKSSPFASLKKAIDLVLEGETVLGFSAEAGGLLTLVNGDGHESNGAPPHPRELEVLLQVAHGKSNKEVASYLGISERTVQAHLVSLFRRWDVASRSAAVLRAVRAGYIDMSDLP